MQSLFLNFVNLHFPCISLYKRSPFFKIYGFTAVYSNGIGIDGAETQTRLFATTKDRLYSAYEKYAKEFDFQIDEGNFESETDENGNYKMSFEEFAKEAAKGTGGIGLIQMADWHFQLDFFEQEIQTIKSEPQPEPELESKSVEEIFKAAENFTKSGGMRKRDLRILTEEMIGDIEGVGWKVTEYEDEWLIENHSPAGEDLPLEIPKGENIIKWLKENAESFDPDDHAALLISMRGQYGIPNSVTELVADASRIQEMYTELADVLSKYAEEAK